MPRRKHVNIKLDGIAGKLGAEVYSESPGFICILPNDVHESVVGKGMSVAEAVENWDLKLKAHLRNADEDDVIVLYVKSLLIKDQSKEDIKIKPAIPRLKSRETYRTEQNKSQHVIDFENQFYSSRRKN